MTTLVLLPGLDGTAKLFEPLRACLDPAVPLQAIAYPAKTFLSYPQLTEFVRENLPGGPLLLLGESFSGPVAIELAAAEAKRVAGVILSTTFVRSPSLLLKRLEALLPFMPVGFMPRWLLEHFLFGRFATPQLRVLLADALAAVPAAILKRRLREVACVEVSGALRALRCPLLYLQASQDRLVPDSAAAVITGIAREASVCRLEGPHCLLQAAAAPAARLIEAFGRSVSGRAGTITAPLR